MEPATNSGPTLVSIVRVQPGKTPDDDADASSRAKKKTPIVCRPSDTIQEIKARYLKDSPRRDQIQLQLKYNGKLLSDADTLVGAKVAHGGWLYYESVFMSPKPSTNALPFKTGGMPPLNLSAASVESNTSCKPEIIADTKGVSFKAEGARALVLSAGKPKLASNVHKNETEIPNFGRKLAYAHKLVVNHCVFQIIHMHEGRWSGDAIAVDAKGSVKSVSNVSLSFSDATGLWTEQRSVTDNESGFTTKTNFLLAPASDGVMRVSLDGCALALRMEERRNVILFTGVDIETERIAFVETITLLDDMRRVRSSQHFDQSGDVRTITYVEKRVIGALDGAMEPCPKGQS